MVAIFPLDLMFKEHFFFFLTQGIISVLLQIVLLTIDGKGGAEGN